MIHYNFKDLENKTCIISGGGGVIAGALIHVLLEVGLKVIALDISKETLEELRKREGEPDNLFVFQCNVQDMNALREVASEVKEQIGVADFLINAAGGNAKQATTDLEEILPGKADSLDGSFFDLSEDAFDRVFDLNYKGTLLPCMVFGKEMVERQSGVILNVSSMNSFRPLTKIPAYSSAKASINNLTQWLAVHFGKTGVRVNAIAPGFFETSQNRFLLFDEEQNDYTARGKKILSNTPMGYFGEPQDLTGIVLFLLSEMSSYITGTVIPVDGGYSAYGGV